MAQARASALQVWSPEFKPQSHQKKTAFSIHSLTNEEFEIEKQQCWSPTAEAKEGAYQGFLV
jgi:hypothetical protein